MCAFPHGGSDYLHGNAVKTPSRGGIKGRSTVARGEEIALWSITSRGAVASEGDLARGGRYAIPGGYGSHEGFNHDEKRKLGGYTYRSLRSKRRYA